MIRYSAITILLGIALTELAAADQPAATVGPAKGALVIMGGGGKDRKFPEIFGKFVQLAGGKEARIVVVTTAASSDPDYKYERSSAARIAKEVLGVAEVTVMHTHDREKADTEEFVKPLATATGVWFGGGRQWRLTKAYGGSRTERKFHKVLERGGAIGGSSAGATIQGSFLARGDTSGNTIMVGDVQRGFGFMRDTAIDQHLLARGREKDLLRVLEDPKKKMRKEFDRGGMLGIGIDEDVAIVVKGNRFDVIGKDAGAVLVYDPKSWEKDTPDEKKWVTVRTGGRYDLKERKVLKEAPVPTGPSKSKP